jgi:uncharacterized membrane protein
VFRVDKRGRDLVLGFGRPGPDLRRVAPGQRVWVTGDPAAGRDTERLLRAPLRSAKQALHIAVEGRAGAPLGITARTATHEVAVGTRASAQRARSGGLTADILRDKLGSLGDTPFELAALDTTRLDADLHVPVSELKAARRALVAALESQTAGAAPAPEARPLPVRPHFASRRAAAPAAEPLLVPLCRHPAQLDAAIALGLPEVELDWMEMVGLARAVEQARSAGMRVTLATLRVQKPGEESWDGRLARLQPDGVLVRHWGGMVHFARQRDAAPDTLAQVRIHGDFSLNVTNSMTAHHLFDWGLDTLTASHDLDENSSSRCSTMHRRALHDRRPAPHRDVPHRALRLRAPAVEWPRLPQLRPAVREPRGRAPGSSRTGASGHRRRRLPQHRLQLGRAEQRPARAASAAARRAALPRRVRARDRIGSRDDPGGVSRSRRRPHRAGGGAARSRGHGAARRQCEPDAVARFPTRRIDLTLECGAARIEPARRTWRSALDAREFERCGRGGLVLLLFVSLAAAACSKKPKAETAAKPPAADAEKPAWKRGLLVMRPGVQSFHTCNDTSTYWVEDRTKGDLTFAFEQLGTGPERPMYVEILAQPTPPPAQGPGSNQRRALAVSGLRLAAFADEGGGCDPERATYEYKARGNEPFWSVTVTRQAIVFAQPDDPTRIEFPYVASVLNGPRRFYSTRTTSPAHTLEFWIEDRRCTDTMAGEILPYVAIARFNGRTLQGCALDGDLAPADAFPAATPQTGAKAEPPPLFGDPAVAPKAAGTTNSIPSPGGGSLGYFSNLVGQKPVDAGLWRSYPLATRVYSLLGPRYELLLTNMQEAQPIAREKNLYSVLGHKMLAPTEQAALVVDLDQDAIYVWLFSQGQSEEFREGGRPIPLPANVRDAIAKATVTP